MKIAIIILTSMFGWVIVHRFTSNRDLNNKKREIIIEHLVEAYRTLTHEVSQRELDDNIKKMLENIISDIQLFGSDDQIKLVKIFADTVANDGGADLDQLINSLRSDLRDQLKLSSVEGNIKSFRFNK